MNEKKEFLTEENYEKGKKKLKTIALVILIVGWVIGGSLIATGLIKSNKLKKQNEQVVEQVEETNNSRTASEVQSDIDSVQEQIDTLETEITKLGRERTRIFEEDRGFSDRYYAKEDEIEEKQKEMTKLQTQLAEYTTELWQINSGYNDVKNRIDGSRNVFSTAKYIPYYMFGAFIIIASCMISGSIFMFTKRREILAFTAQQVMPVAQEGIEKAAPTIGKAGASIAKEMAPVYGDIAKGIAKGIKEGINEADNKNTEEEIEEEK